MSAQGAQQKYTHAAGDVGLIFHWGPYSVPAYDDPDSAGRRKTQNGSEWYKRRLEEKGTFHPVSGYRETQRHHAAKYPGLSYDDLAVRFVPNDWDPESFMDIAESIGAKYVILTAKHHDGYCLWPTLHSWGGSSARDLVGDFIGAARKRGLVTGIYYSWLEFGRSMTATYLKKVTAQIVELQKNYAPSIWWFDGHWALKTDKCIGVAECVVDLLKQRSALVNDRLGTDASKFAENQDFLGCASFRVYADRAIPVSAPKVPWESIHTIGLSWGYNSAQRPEHFKTGAQLAKIYDTVRCKGGRLLLNLGPKADGSLDENELKSLKEFGVLMHKRHTKRVVQQPPPQTVVTLALPDPEMDAYIDELLA